jgi:hypothetical protein
MAFKTGLVLGLGVGYVLGSRAGRERYEELVRAWKRFTGSPAVQRAAGRASEVAGQGAKRGLHAVQRGVEKAGSAVRERLDGSDVEADYSR